MLLYTCIGINGIWGKKIIQDLGWAMASATVPDFTGRVF